MNKRNALFLLISLAIAILESIGLVVCFREIQWTMLIYYTQLSNIFLLVAAIIDVIFSARTLRARKKVPNWIYKLFYSATCTTTVTILTVVFVLSWMYGDLFYVLTAGSMLYTHTLCPILAIITTTCLIPKDTLANTDASRALIFTLAYALIAIILNIAKIIRGPYPFLFVYEQPIWASIAWIIGILGGAYGIARLLLVGKTKSTK